MGHHSSDSESVSARKKGKKSTSKVEKAEKEWLADLKKRSAKAKKIAKKAKKYEPSSSSSSDSSSSSSSESDDKKSKKKRKKKVAKKAKKYESSSSSSSESSSDEDDKKSKKKKAAKKAEKSSKSKHGDEDNADGDTKAPESKSEEKVTETESEEKASPTPEKASPTPEKPSERASKPSSNKADSKPATRGYADKARQANPSQDTLDVTGRPTHHSFEEMNEALKTTAKHPHHPPDGFGKESEGDGVHLVFAWKYGGTRGCQLNMCKHAFIVYNTKCPNGKSCPFLHKWPAAEQMTYLATQPSPEGKENFRKFCKKFYKTWLHNWHKFYKNDDRLEPKPMLPVTKPLRLVGKSPESGQSHTAQADTSQAGSSTNIGAGDFDSIPGPAAAAPSDQRGASTRKRTTQAPDPPKEKVEQVRKWQDEDAIKEQDRKDQAEHAAKVAANEERIAQGGVRYDLDEVYKTKDGREERSSRPVFGKPMGFDTTLPFRGFGIPPFHGNLGGTAPIGRDAGPGLYGTTKRLDSESDLKAELARIQALLASKKEDGSADGKGDGSADKKEDSSAAGAEGLPEKEE